MFKYNAYTALLTCGLLITPTAHTMELVVPSVSTFSEIPAGESISGYMELVVPSVSTFSEIPASESISGYSEIPAGESISGYYDTPAVPLSADGPDSVAALSSNFNQSATLLPWEFDAYGPYFLGAGQTIGAFLYWEPSACDIEIGIYFNGSHFGIVCTGGTCQGSTVVPSTGNYWIYVRSLCTQPIEYSIMYWFN
ncbi:MAG: hypothetical protein DRQ49_08570 [Gammaproteobacteria bacterium]|nr:MAG: hypothetical protein DRQ49_08570 [Gammaproteobacteria bacterium]RKZ44144.1 MAG: hypothetical protein DRQ41_03535 [Gammaproteobacteria bacterium]RKZ73857.1 MAG: hypothetical protein DRQ57_13040 [Gammaproteobacteria bacterium]